MDEIYDIKRKLNEMQPELMDVIFYVSLLRRFVYTMI